MPKPSRDIMAHTIAELVQIRERVDFLLALLLPDAAGDCPHPPDKVTHEITLDDEIHPYTCTLCGAESNTPFPSIQPGS